MVENETVYYIAPYWENEGYGGASTRKTEKEAMEAKKDMEKYNLPAIHVWKLERTRISGFDEPENKS